jgi:subtilisin family serine protease
MTKFILSFFLSSAFLTNAISQTPKINFALHQLLTQSNSSARIVSILVKGDPQKIKSVVLQDGGKFKYAMGGICSVTLPINSIKDLAGKDFVKRMEITNVHPVILDDSTDINVNMTSVRDSMAPLDKLYTGKGVVVGIVDGGIDIHHYDFRNADSTTRIKYIWDQNDDTTGNTPVGYGYGTEWTAQQIDNGTCDYVEQWLNANFHTHGSNVSGVAAGNGLADGYYPGIATKADIIVVSYNINDPTGSNEVDAFKYIFDKADQLGEPCVINASFTPGYDGSHDGNDLNTELIDSLIAAKNGRMIVCATGNAGNVPFHLGYKVNADTSFTWFTYNQYAAAVLFDLYSNKSNFANVNFSVGADDSTKGDHYKGNVRFRNVITDFHNSPDTLIQDTLIHLGHQIGIINYYLDIEEDSVYHLGIIIQTDSTGALWRFMTTGNGYFDAWNNTGLGTGTSTMVLSKIPDSTIYPAFRYYKLPDINQTIGSGFTCSDHVISVANYKNRNSYIDWQNVVQNYPTDTVGARSIGSSIGPTRDGRIKPDVAAPGDHTLAADNSLWAASALKHGAFQVAFDTIHSVNGGTSLSSPVVTGIVALYLEKFPQASWKQIIGVIQQRTYKDQFTGNALPNTEWGYGKVDAFDVLTSVYGCTDPNAQNFDSLANVDNDSCIVINGIKNLPNGNQLSCFPNPAKNFVQFNYHISHFVNGMTISVYDLNGKMIQRFPLVTSQGSISMQLQTISAGFYFYQLEMNGRSLETHKFACIH